MERFSVAGDYGTWDVLRSAEKKKNRRNFWGPVPLDRLQLFFYGLCPSAELHYTNCVPDFCWKFFFSAELLEASAPWSLAIFCTDYVIFCFSAELHYTNCVPDICWKYFFSAELSIQTYGSAELNITKCVVDFCWFNGFPQDFCWFFFFSAELSITKCAPEFCWFVWIFGGSS